MPFRRRSYKRGKGSRRRNRKFRKARQAYRYNKSGRMLTYKGPSFMPDRFFTKLKLTDTLALVPGAVAVGELIVIGNDLHDPLGTSGTSQPQGFDQFCPAMYNQFRVHGSKVRAWFISASDSTGTGDCVVWVYPSVTSATVSSAVPAQNYLQQRSHWKVASRGSRNIAYIKNYMQTKIIGGVQDISDEPDYAGDSTTAPLRQWYWHLGFGTIDATTGATMKMVIEVTYYCEFIGRKTIALS